MPLTNEERMWIQNLQVQLDAHTNDIAQIRATLQRMHEKEIYEQGQAAGGGPQYSGGGGGYPGPRFGESENKPRDITMEGKPGEFGVKE